MSVFAMTLDKIYNIAGENSAHCIEIFICF